MNKGRLLIVEDETLLRMDLREMLTDAGYEVVGEASNGESALELAQQLAPDLILMDVKMPKLNGIKASRILGKMTETPILLISAFSQVEWIEQADEANIVGYLVKPVRQSDLLPAVEVALFQAKKLSRLNAIMRELERKLEVRIKIEQAKGKLMQRLNCTEQQAYETMRSYCMRERISMEALAEEICEHNTGPPRIY